MPSGFMQAKFQINQPFNFQNYSYVIVFDTAGDGYTPDANGTQTAYRGYNFAIVISGASGAVTATPYYFYRPSNNAAPILLPVTAVAGQLQFTLNSNGQNTQFQVLFNRVLASAFSTPTPAGSATASPTPTPTPSPSPTASGSPGASPSASPTATPPNLVSTTWTFNYFVVQGSIQQGVALIGGVSGANGAGYIVDSLGSGGANDATYTSPALDTTASFDTGPFYPQAGTHASDPSAQIQSGEISNNP